jgi:acetylornithine/N-succinyldiaminopimelate aminotransferase
MSYLYNTFPFEPAFAKDITIFSKTGEKYTDTFAGIGVNAFGYSYEPLLERLQQKMNRYIHLSNFIEDPDLPFVVKNLLQFSSGDLTGDVLFTNSGTEATEAALKVLLKARSGKRDKIVYFSGSFHGRTLGALAVNGEGKFRQPFEPLLTNTVELPWNDLPSLQRYFADQRDEILGVILEPIQGSGGVVPIDALFADEINNRKRDIPFYLICDEVQSGLGRSGKYFAFEHFSLKPDMIILGKAFGGGLPLGAVILLGKTAEILVPGDHGSTFAPNPVALAGARFLTEQLPTMLRDIAKSGDYLHSLLQTLPIKMVKDVRGKGLMIGLELSHPSPLLAQEAFRNHHLLLNVIHQHTIRLLPPLNITKLDIDEIFKKLESVVN